MRDNRGTGKASRQNGFVSIIVVTVLAIILGLISIGFSKLMDRELRQALDRELSAQAYYSAYSGLDDAIRYLQNGGGSFNGCAPPVGSPYFSNDISGSNEAKYSCISVNANPKELTYNIAEGDSQTVKLANLPSLDRIYIGWEDQAGGNQPLGNCSGSTCDLPQEFNLSPNKTGELRVGVYPVPAGAGTCNSFNISSDTNGALSCFSRNYYFYPNQAGGGPGRVDYTNKALNGSFVPGNCVPGRYLPFVGAAANSRYCYAYIDNLQNIVPAGTTTFYLQLLAQYAKLSISVIATDSGNGQLTFDKGVQGVVDVTGRGTDVLQRIRAHVDLQQQYNIPTYGIQSMDTLCKGFTVEVTSPGTYGNATIDNSIANNDGACVAPTGGGGVGSSAGDVGPSTWPHG